MLMHAMAFTYGVLIALFTENDAKETIMALHLNVGISHPDQLHDAALWEELYSWLRSCVRHLVYAYRVSCWYGQEEDIIDDVVQETIRRTIERSQRTAYGEVAPIYALEHLMVVVAKNYIRDVRRHEQRVVRLPDNQVAEARLPLHDTEDPLEVATVQLGEEHLFHWIAKEIANFPLKQRQALLIDLANRMYFDTEPTPLQGAFLTVGIDLQDYRLPLPIDPVERSRHASLLSYAYKRLHLAFRAEDTLVS